MSQATGRTATVTLSRSVIDADGQTVNTLTFREPNGRDIVTCGYPLLLSEQGGFDAPAMAKMIAHCGNLLPPVVETLPISDWTKCAGAISSFLGEPVATSSTSISTPPISGAPAPNTPSA